MNKYLTLTVDEFKLKYNIDESNYFDSSVKIIISDESYGIVIGKDNYFCAGTLIFGATGYRENTIIGSNNYFGPSTVIKNDVFIGNNNTFDSSTYIGNLSNIQNYTKIESNSNICDHTSIGSFSHVGCLTPIYKDVKPFCKVYGNPPKINVNAITANTKKRFSSDELIAIKEYVKSSIIPDNIKIQTVIDEFTNISRKKQY